MDSPSLNKGRQLTLQRKGKTPCVHRCPRSSRPLPSGCGSKVGPWRDLYPPETLSRCTSERRRRARDSVVTGRQELLALG